MPSIRNKEWTIHNPIDQFILARLEQEKLQPSKEAPREVLLRRLSLDLTGLPPTPKETDDFVKDISPNAYERQVDRLLNSPHYGEKMAVDWLDLARYADLVKKDYVTQEEYERIRTNAAALEAAVAADRAAVDNATVQLEYCTLRSAIDGRTGKLMVNRGNLVKADADTPLVVINQIDPIYVAFSVPQQELPEIKSRRAAGRLEVKVTIPESAAQPPPGTLSFIDNAVDATTGMVLLKATFPNHDRLLWPGQFVTASLQIAIKPNALLVPTQAIQTGQQGPFVYVVKPDLSVESRPVVPERAYEHETIVVKGVQAGEKVVTDGQLRLVPGAAVKIQDAPSPASAPEARR